MLNVRNNKHFFPLTGGCSEGLGAFRFFFKQQHKIPAKFDITRSTRERNGWILQLLARKVKPRTAERRWMKNPVWPSSCVTRLVRPKNLMSRMNRKKTHTHTQQLQYKWFCNKWRLLLYTVFSKTALIYRVDVYRSVLCRCSTHNPAAILQWVSSAGVNLRVWVCA